MKKVLVALLLIVTLFTVCACSYVSPTSFLSDSQLRSITKAYGTDTLQAEVTLTYDKTDYGDSKERVVKITYDLLLTQAPLAVIRFIQLANEGVYENTLIDEYNSSYYYMVMGRYAGIKEGESSSSYKYYDRRSDVTFAGEFKSNGYAKPAAGYAEFSSFALAMYHSNASDGSSFNEANGTLILALDKVSLNPNNYAVFAQFKSLTYTLDGVVQGSADRTSIPDNIMTDLKSFSSTTSRTVLADEDDTKGTSIRMLSTRVFLSVKILGDYNWNKLPKIGK